MRRYWSVTGAVGAIAAIGLFTYVSRDHLYQETETEEYIEDELGYEPEFPEEVELPVPPAIPKVKKGKESQNIIRHNSSKYPEKETKKKGPYPHNSLFPASPGLEDYLEEDEEERPWYDLPQEERDLKDKDELKGYFYQALGADDYRVAETYIDNILEHSEKDDEIQAKIDLVCKIRRGYLYYLKSVRQNCTLHDPYSVLRKVISTNAIIDKYKDIYCFFDGGPYHEKAYGMETFQTVIDCQKDEHE